MDNNICAILCFNTIHNIIIYLKIKQLKLMIFFFNSSRKSDKLTHPVTICAGSEKRAIAIAIVKFLEWGYKGSPVKL